jgi:DNA-binding CsgD family transcriptional regulator
VTTPHATRRTPAGELTPLELQVVTELAQGGTHQRIARRLGTTTSAISTTIHRANSRLRTAGPANLVAVAIGLRLIRPDIAVPSARAAAGLIEERVARYMAAEDWLEDPADDAWWAGKVPKFREDYLTSARKVIALVRGEAVGGPQGASPGPG